MYPHQRLFSEFTLEQKLAPGELFLDQTRTLMTLNMVVLNTTLDFDQVQTAMLTRSVGKGFKSSNFVLTSANCSLQTVLPSAEPCEASAANIPNGYSFCYRTDQTSTIEDLACCRSCAKPGGSGVKPGVIAAMVVGSVVGIALSCCVLFFVICRKGMRQM